MERGLEPPPPIEVDPATMSDQDRGRDRVERYPTTLDDALKQLESASIFPGSLGELLAQSYIAVRRSEWVAYSHADQAFQLRNHFLKY